MSRKTKGTYIIMMTLIKTLKIMKKEPMKIWVKKDFRNYFMSMRDYRYFETLEKLGLIEKVNAVYYTGHRRTISHDTMGYRILKEKIK